MPPTAEMRSVADVLAYVNEQGIVDENVAVRFYARSWTLPDGKQTGTVAATVESRSLGTLLQIKLPTCFGFHAALSDGTPLPTIPIADLNGAIASRDGLVRLAPTKIRPNGLLVKKVTFLPAPFDCSFSEIEDIVVKYAIKHLGMEEYCYREIARHELPGLKRLDYRRVSQFQMPSQKAVLNFVEDKLKKLMADCFDRDARADYDAWRGRGSLRSAIARTLKRSGLQQLRNVEPQPQSIHNGTLHA